MNLRTLSFFINNVKEVKPIDEPVPWIIGSMSNELFVNHSLLKRSDQHWKTVLCITVSHITKFNPIFITDISTYIILYYGSFTLTETDLNSDPKPDSYIVLCRTFHIAQTRNQIPTPNFCIGQESESESVP